MTGPLCGMDAVSRSQRPGRRGNGGHYPRATGLTTETGLPEGVSRAGPRDSPVSQLLGAPQARGPQPGARRMGTRARTGRGLSFGRAGAADAHAPGPPAENTPARAERTLGGVRRGAGQRRAEGWGGGVASSVGGLVLGEANRGGGNSAEPPGDWPEAGGSVVLGGGAEGPEGHSATLRWWRRP